MLIVNPLVPATTIPEFIAYARANSKKANMASSNQHVPSGRRLFKMMAGVDIQHVPYRGAAPPLTDLLASRSVLLPTTPSCIEHIRASRVRGLCDHREPAGYGSRSAGHR